MIATRPTNDTKHALIYCRVSTRRQEEEGTSLESQAEYCVKHAEALGYAVGRVTREIYSGAELWDRPLLAQDRADLKAGRFQALVAYSTDRLSRSLIHLAIVAEECDRANVELIFVTEPLDSTPEGQLIQYVRGYAAAVEREKIRERNMRGKHAHVRSGKAQTWGFAPYGYSLNRQAGIRVIDNAQALIVRRIFCWVGEDGLSLSEVARRLNTAEVESPGTAKYERRGPDWKPRWNVSQVSRIIRRPDYKGAAFALTTKADKNGRRVPREREEWVELPAHVSPAIVSADLWESAQNVAATYRVAKTRNAQRPYLLRGLIECAVCGLPMRSTPDHGRFIYRCSSREKPGGHCEGKPVPASDAIPKSAQPRTARGQCVAVDGETRARLATIPGVETWAWEQVMRLLQNPSVIQAEIERQRGAGPDPAISDDMAKAKAVLAKTEAQQQRLLQHYMSAGDDEFPWELVQREIGRLENEKQTITSTIVDLEAQLSQQSATAYHLDELGKYCSRVSQNLVTFDFDQKRLALEALGVSVAGSGRDWRITFRIPLDQEDSDRRSFPTL